MPFFLPFWKRAEQAPVEPVPPTQSDSQPKPVSAPPPKTKPPRRRINAAGRHLIREWEGYRIKAYDDGGGVPTICTGHTGGVSFGTVVTDEQCERFFEADLADHDIEPLLKGAATTDNQFAAMTSLCFNIGLTRFAGSTVLKRHKLGNYAGAANAFLLWKYDNGKVVRGLVRRREAERTLYLS